MMVVNRMRWGVYETFGFLTITPNVMNQKLYAVGILNKYPILRT